MGAMTRRELRFAAEDGVRLSGTLHLPDRSTSAAAVVAVHGAAMGLRSDRLYEHLVATLVPEGFAVFAFDRRGEGASDGVPDAPLGLLASDARCAVSAVAGQPEIDAGRVGIWGLSQGGWIGPMAAANDDRIAFVIAASASGVSPSVQMHFAMENVLRERGFDDAVVGRAHEVRSAIERDYEAGDRSGAVDVLRDVSTEPWFPWAFLPEVSDIEREPDGEQFELDLDVAATLADVRVPALAIYGERDRWVPIEDSIEVWRTAYGGDPADLAIARVPDVGHMMTLSDPDDLDEAGPFSSVYARTMADWLLSRTGSGSG
jgi:pimeloyl-ACP methyl ester carboxylesterase